MASDDETYQSDGDEKDMKSSVLNKKKKFRVQRFRDSWKLLPQFRGWLARGKEPNKAYCLICDKDLTAGKSELSKHGTGKSHLKKAKEKNLDVNNLQDLPCVQESFEECELDTTSLQEDLSSIENRFRKPRSSMFIPQKVKILIDEEELSDTGLTQTLRFIDLRSDTVTRTCKAMKEAMFYAPEGDGYADDPSIIALEKKVAELLEKEAAMYVASGTLANLICVLSHCWERGSRVIVGDGSFLHQGSQGGIGQIGSVFPCPIKNLPDGTFCLEELQALIHQEDPDWPATTLVCIENTHSMTGGRVLPLKWLDELGELCHCNELNVRIHMDGARLMNAAVTLGAKPSRLVASCDSVSFCLNKGLGAPMGSLVVGSKEFVLRAAKLRKVLGGCLRQCGMMAAAGIYALDNIGRRLSTDHANARAMAHVIAEKESSAVSVELKSVMTNIVLLHCDRIRVSASQLSERLQSIPDQEFKELGERIIVMTLPISDSLVRLMTHHDIKKDDVKAVKRKLKYVIEEYDSIFNV